MLLHIELVVFGLRVRFYVALLKSYSMRRHGDNIAIPIRGG